MNSNLLSKTSPQDAPLKGVPGILSIGSVIRGSYRVDGFLGAGGGGLVYLCSDLQHSNRKVALKVLAPQLSHERAFIVRFAREVRLTAKIKHPHVAPTLDYIVSGHLMAYAMEYLDGGSLAQLLTERGSLPIKTAAHLLFQIASGLAAIHAEKIVHRDLKPQNILLNRNGMLKITDFGIAKAGDSTVLTQHGAVIGSIPYLSPEYIERGESDQRTDIYALGVIAFEMLTGRLPFNDTLPLHALRKKVECAAPAVKSIRPDCPNSINALIAAMLERRPNRRLASSAEVVRILLRMDELASWEPVAQELLEATPLAPMLIEWAKNDPKIDTGMREKILATSIGARPEIFAPQYSRGHSIQRAVLAFLFSIGAIGIIYPVLPSPLTSVATRLTRAVLHAAQLAGIAHAPGHPFNGKDRLIAPRRR